MILPLLLAAAPLPPQVRAPVLSPADTNAAFVAAGLTRRPAGGWRACTDDPDARATVEQVIDLNADGRMEAVVEESALRCTGDVPAYWVVTRDGPGKWRLVTSGQGIVTALSTKGAAGWRDLEIGGPGFCFPVERWNGREYALNRFQYEGKVCKPPR